jgi:hypothetical protein
MNILEKLPDYIQAFAILIGGGWVYWKFIYQRQKEPATDIDIDVRFVGTQNEKWIIEVTCSLENKSLVRHTYRDFQLTVRYLLAGDEVEDGPKELQYQLKFPRTIDIRLNEGNVEGKKKRYFAGVDVSQKNQNYINPKQSFRHRYITWVPADATFVWIQCKFCFDSGRNKLQKVNSQKIYRVPARSEQGVVPINTRQRGA